MRENECYTFITFNLLYLRKEIQDEILCKNERYNEFRVSDISSFSVSKTKFVKTQSLKH